MLLFSVTKYYFNNERWLAEHQLKLVSKMMSQIRHNSASPEPSRMMFLEKYSCGHCCANVLIHLLINCN